MRAEEGQPIAILDLTAKDEDNDDNDKLVYSLETDLPGMTLFQNGSLVWNLQLDVATFAQVGITLPPGITLPLLTAVAMLNIDPTLPVITVVVTDPKGAEAKANIPLQVCSCQVSRFFSFVAPHKTRPLSFGKRANIKVL